MFKLHSDYKSTGDQPQAIEYLSNGIKEGKKFQTLLGVTGSGKTFTMANIIQKVQKPTLVLAHNKTLVWFRKEAIEYLDTLEVGDDSISVTAMFIGKDDSGRYNFAEKTYSLLFYKFYNFSEFEK